MSAQIALGFAGKLMGYAGTANATDDMTAAVASYLNYVSHFDSGAVETRVYRTIPLEIIRVLCGPEEGHRALAASVQKAWGKMALDAMQDIIKSTNAVETVDGIGLSGGCAFANNCSIIVFVFCAFSFNFAVAITTKALMVVYVMFAIVVLHQEPCNMWRLSSFHTMLG